MESWLELQGRADPASQPRGRSGADTVLVSSSFGDTTGTAYSAPARSSASGDGRPQPSPPNNT